MFCFSDALFTFNSCTLRLQYTTVWAFGTGQSKEIPWFASIYMLLIAPWVTHDNVTERTLTLINSRIDMHLRISNLPRALAWDRSHIPAIFRGKPATWSKNPLAPRKRQDNNIDAMTSGRPEHNQHYTLK